MPVEFDSWIEGMEDLDPGREVLAEWTQAMERFYGATQEHVHRITGALQASGHHETERSGPTDVTGTLTYTGNAERSYAAYEFGRGGDHDAITLGFAQSRRGFEQALADGLDKHVRSFL